MRKAFALPAERAGDRAEAAILDIRRSIAQAAAAGIWRTEPEPTSVSMGDVEVLRFAPSGESAATVAHFHGGAFRIGCPEQVGPFASALAGRCGVTVLCPRYRLAPEHPFPAAVRDGLSVLHALRASSGDPVIISGDSAGGGLAAGLTALAVAEEDAPAALILLSPWLDLRVTNASYEANAGTDPLFSGSAAAMAAHLYLRGQSADHPIASPGLGPVTGFPPTLVNFGTGEVLADDSRCFADALAANHVPVEVDAVPGMDHVAVTRGLALPGAAQTLERVCDFIDRIVTAAGR